VTGAARSLYHPNNFKRVPTLSFDAIAIAGDVIHNLRSALDHLANQLVLVGLIATPLSTPLTEAEWRQIEFPICDGIAKYKSSKAGKVKGMTPMAKEAIDRLKPYKGGNDALWRIHELDNIDKHRTLFTVARDFLFTSDWFDGGAYLRKADNPNFSSIEPNVEQDVQAEINESVSNLEVTQSNALLPTLHQLVDFVDGLVLSFKPLLE
jgi:hypothetical protein